jgi:RNA polymerase sigma-70 factor (ECF subfamily)
LQAGADDEALVRRAQAGDQTAFGALMARYDRAVYGFVYRLTQSPEAAEDVTQEVFLRAWRYLGRFDARRPFRPWLYRIAANRAFSRKEHDRSRQALALDELEVEPATPDNVLTELERSEIGVMLRRALLDLSPQQRQAIVLVELEDQTAIEAAEVMGCSAATVRQHVFRAKKRLRVLLGPFMTGSEPEVA